MHCSLFRIWRFHRKKNQKRKRSKFMLHNQRKNKFKRPLNVVSHDLKDMIYFLCQNKSKSSVWNSCDCQVMESTVLPDRSCQSPYLDWQVLSKTTVPPHCGPCPCNCSTWWVAAGGSSAGGSSSWATEVFLSVVNLMRSEITWEISLWVHLWWIFSLWSCLLRDCVT